MWSSDPVTFLSSLAFTVSIAGPIIAWLRFQRNFGSGSTSLVIMLLNSPLRFFVKLVSSKRTAYSTLVNTKGRCSIQLLPFWIMESLEWGAEGGVRTELRPQLTPGTILFGQPLLSHLHSAYSFYSMLNASRSWTCGV